MARIFPANLVNLQNHLDAVRAEAVKRIEENDDFGLHAVVIESALNSIHYFIHRNDPKNDNDLTIRLLGIRLFNAISAAYTLLLTGYYQASASQQRDVVETAFLLDYFGTDEALILEWKNASEKLRKEKFSPAAVRKAIDARDGYTEKKREKHYQLLSRLASHPHPLGFAMSRLPNGLHHCGPYLEQKVLAATLTELGQSAVQAGTLFGVFFDSLTKIDHQTDLLFLDARQEWFLRFYGSNAIDPAELRELRELTAKL